MRSEDTRRDRRLDQRRIAKIAWASAPPSFPPLRVLVSPAPKGQPPNSPGQCPGNCQPRQMIGPIGRISQIGRIARGGWLMGRPLRGQVTKAQHQNLRRGAQGGWSWQNRLHGVPRAFIRRPRRGSWQRSRTPSYHRRPGHARAGGRPSPPPAANWQFASSPDRGRAGVFSSQFG